MNRAFVLLTCLAVLSGCPGEGSSESPTPTLTPNADPGSGLPTAAISKSQLKANMIAVQQGAEKYKVERDEYPADVATLIKAEWLREKESTDPWGRPYLIQTKGRKLLVVTYGADGKPGGSGPDTDYTSDEVVKGH